MWSPTINEADRLGIACCLETSPEENRRFYERRDFEQTGEVILRAGQIRGGYVGVRRGWMPSELGIGKQKSILLSHKSRRKA
jgi:hypothetical protein